MPADMRSHGAGWQAEALGDLSRFYSGQPQDIDLVFDLWFHFALSFPKGEESHIDSPPQKH